MSHLLCPSFGDLPPTSFFISISSSMEASNSSLTTSKSCFLFRLFSFPNKWLTLSKIVCLAPTAVSIFGAPICLLYYLWHLWPVHPFLRHLHPHCYPLIRLLPVTEIAPLFDSCCSIISGKFLDHIPLTASWIIISMLILINP